MSDTFTDSMWRDRARSVKMGLDNSLRAAAEGIKTYPVPPVAAFAMKQTLERGQTEVSDEAYELIRKPAAIYEAEIAAWVIAVGQEHQQEPVVN